MRQRSRLKTHQHSIELKQHERNKTTNERSSEEFKLLVSGDKISNNLDQLDRLTIYTKKHSINREHMLKKLSLTKPRLKEWMDSNYFIEKGKPKGCQSPSHLANMQLVKQLLARYNMKFIENDHLNSNKRDNVEIVHTYGLKIKTMKYNIPLRPKINSESVGVSRPNHMGHSEQIKSKAIRLERDRQSPSIQNINRQKKQLSSSQSKFRFKNYTQPVQVDEPFNELMRLKRYREFLFVINMSNRIYRQLQFDEYHKPFKYYIGIGNNAQLIRSVLKKRFWLIEATSLFESNFVWTQIKVKRVLDSQQDKQPLQYDQILTITNSSGKKAGPNSVQMIDSTILSFANLVSESDLKTYKKHTYFIRKQMKSEPLFEVRARMLNMRFQSFDEREVQHNHLPNNGVLGNKKALFYILREYCDLNGLNVFSIVPKTYHVQLGLNDNQFNLFVEAFKKKEGSVSTACNVWIVKPGEDTNRGSGIMCCNTIEAVKKIVGGCTPIEGSRTYILQEYITNPLLYNSRKFDIRVYMLLTMNNGVLKGYWYREGYVRTSSYKYDLRQVGDPMIHLTNDAIQKNCPDYGRYQQGNKLSFNELHRYIRTTMKGDFYLNILPQMKKIATQCVQSAYVLLTSRRKISNFELFGLDFMIDDRLKPWLLEVNTNPCLELCCGVLQRLIPNMIENCFRIAVDPLFPPPTSIPWCSRHNISESPAAFNKFQLIFDELRDGIRLQQLYRGSKIGQQIGNAPQEKNKYADSCDGPMSQEDY